MKKIFILITTLLLCLSLFVSCSDGTAMNDSYAGMKGDYNYSGGAGYDSESVMESTPTSTESEAAALERKIIKTYRVSLETKNYDSAVNKITAAATSFGGYIAEARQDGSGDTERERYASFTIRVPKDRAEEFLAYISENENVVSSTLATDDVTDSYYGYQATLESLTVQEERLMSMLEKAETLSELLQLEDKLSEVRAEINGIHSKLQLMDKSVDYSYVYVTLDEVKEYKEPEKETYFSRFIASFGEAFTSFATVIGEILIIFIWLLPYLLVLGVVVALVLFFTARGRKRKEKKTENQTEKKDEE